MGKWNLRLMTLKAGVSTYTLIPISECILLEASSRDQPEDHRTQSWKEAPRPFCPSLLPEALGISTSEFYFCLQNFCCMEGVQAWKPLQHPAVCLPLGVSSCLGGCSQLSADAWHSPPTAPARRPALSTPFHVHGTQTS